MRTIIIFILLFVCSNAELLSQSSTARFLYWSPSAEITGQGGAGVAIINNSFAAYYNPASFAFSKKNGISSSFMQPFSSFSNTSQFMLSISRPVREIGTIALSFNGYWIDSQIRTGSESPSPLGMTQSSPTFIEPTHYQIKASYANKIASNVSFGVSASYLRIALSVPPTELELGNGIASTILLDAGFLIKDLLTDATYQPDSDKNNSKTNDKITPGISIGISFLNLGPKISFIDDTQGDPPPSVALLGLSYTPLITNSIHSRLLIDLEKRIYDSNKLDYIHFGGEVLFYKSISVRSGYVLDNINSELSYFTLGIGIKYKFIYANISRYKKYVLPTWQFDTKISLEL